MAKPSVLVVPGGKLQEQLFTARVRKGLAEVAVPVYNEPEEPLSSEELAGLVQGYEAIITGWGSPQLTLEVLDAATELRIVAHAAGSARFLLPEPAEGFFQRGLRMTSATPTMSRYVAEHTLCLTIACLRRISRFREEIKQSDLWWGTYSELDPDSLIEQRVGMVGLGSIAWAFVRLLKPFQCEVWAYSRHADLDRAAREKVKLVGLEELLTNCPVICLFAAVRPDTVNMISRERLKLIADGSVIVNTARGALVDEEALIEELRAGRLWAGLDVTDPEPPALGSPLRDLPNALLTPHVGGPVPSRYWEMAMFVVQELGRFFRGEPLEAEITEERLRGMA
ncbi:MAG: hydroxyacid dehydrogenase [Armatimonadota bacterium]|nr:MAG: hydroxyacid dehydrogenase [Armatimonadota bacterium]